MVSVSAEGEMVLACAVSLGVGVVAAVGLVDGGVHGRFAFMNRAVLLTVCLILLHCPSGAWGIPAGFFPRRITGPPAPPLQAVRLTMKAYRPAATCAIQAVTSLDTGKPATTDCGSVTRYTTPPVSDFRYQQVP